MSKLSGIKDIDREIMMRIDDKDLLKACSIDKYTWNIVCDDAFLKRRILSKYPEIEKYKYETTWKKFFLNVINYISLVKQKFNYEYTAGDFRKQYYYLKTYDINNILLVSSNKGELGLVIWALKNGANIHINNEHSLIMAASNGHLNVVKYLVEHGSDLHADKELALDVSSLNGHFEVVKYLVEKGSNITQQSLRPIVRKDILNYLLNERERN